MTMYKDIAATNKAWVFDEARKLVARFAKAPPAKGYVLFETGYGPSGLPHIGTFGEVARTSMVRHAFSLMSDIPTKILCFSDDMDGLRKVPDNIANGAMLIPYLGKPLTKVPDPFGKFESFAHHNNAMLRDFLDRFGFDYEFASSTDYYRKGRFDATLLKMLRQYDDVMHIILPTLGPDRRATYSPFLPVCPKTGVVLQVPMVEHDADAGTVTYIDPADGERMTVAVTGGACKLQWKADWAMRWCALDVDYEMAGKDLIDSVMLSGKITRALGSKPPEGFNYELFLDAEGHKISKSKGNGLTIDEWLTYASPESLSVYMYQNPRAAKRLHFDVIPKTVEDYYQHVAAFAGQAPEQQLGNPAYHVHSSAPPLHDLPVNFALLLNLVSVANTNSESVLWSFISQYAPGVSAASHPELAKLVGYAIRYYADRVAPTLQRRAPTDQERAAMADLRAKLDTLPHEPDALQTEVYEIGKRHGFEPLRAWFAALYECLFGQSAGPRMGTFIALYGVENSKRLLDEALARY
jgi:lysyl-tRNA synthetase, class I